MENNVQNIEADDKNDHPKMAMTFAVGESGQMISVRDAENGLNCKCTCPVCHGDLIARQGNVREWHFAHDSGIECDTAGESALHLAAKQLLVDAGGMAVPEAHVTKSIVISGLDSVTGLAERPAEHIDFFHVELEKGLGQIRPDVLAFTDNSMLLVEIAVTHFVDDEKRTILVNGGIPTLEIDLASFHQVEWTWKSLRKVVIESVEYKEWIVNPRDTVLHDLAYEDAIQKLKALSAVQSIGGIAEHLGRFDLMGAPVELYYRCDEKGERRIEAEIMAFNRPAFDKMKFLMLNNGGHRIDRVFLFPAYKKEFLIDYLSGNYKRRAHA